ncbi:MAG: glycosyltransferase family 2 protein [Thermodesulfobacteria bacterium]|nr:glycosyltransferase family 2 protein [Thermodesulfobacteriota bacterium]
MLHLFFATTGIIVLIILAYLFFLAFVAILPEKKGRAASPSKRFLFLIPAHNEEKCIGKTLEHLKGLDYPENLWDVVVVADNCTDATNDIVRSHNVECIERRESGATGKGYVLAWAFERLVARGHDAFVIIDADTHVDKDFLLAMNRHLLQGAQVVQAYSQVRSPESSPLEGLAFLGFALNRNLRYKGRSRLGWQANLMGTGMCFARQVIERYGWPALSKVEDLEMTMFLKLRNIRVVFAPDARVTVRLHSDISSSKGQRLRWDMGKFQVRDKYLPLLFKRFCQTRDISFLDSIMELLLPPFSIFFVGVWGLFLLYVILDFQGPDFVFWIWIGAVGGLVIYTLLGLISAKADARIYRCLFYAPFFMIWRLWIVIMEHIKKERQGQW